MNTAKSLPTGTLTFLFTDVESSTRLWELDSTQMGLAMARHDELIEGIVDRYQGVVVRPRGEGDSRFAVFLHAADALGAAVAIQRAFSSEPWTIPFPMRVRLALHTGEADLRDGDYYGSTVNRCARMRNAAHGGQILISEMTRNLVAASLPEGVGLRDLGAYKLKDLNEPERIYQVNIGGLEADFPALRTQDVFHSNLPLMLTSFIGREHEVAKVKNLLSENRLITITGVGGAGKTRLALKVAEDLTANYSGGVWLVDLSLLSSPTHLVQFFMKNLGLREEEFYDPIETMLESLHSKELLIVLDNCEHLLKDIAQLVEDVLRGTQNLKILATSRESLGVPGEILWFITPLSSPPLGEKFLLAQLGKYDAVKLFLDRARAGRPDFDLTESNSSAVANICTSLDGLPLAIELAAARVRVLEVEEIAERLDDRFRLLVGNRTAVQRQKTLRNLIDWSYHLLLESERILFRRLSIFSGGWTLQAVEEICLGEEFDNFEMIDLMASLVDKSLVIAEPHNGSKRYRYLETIRQYAHELSEANDEANEYALKHAEYFTELAERAYGGLWGNKQRYWLEILDAERENLVAALTFMGSKSELSEMMLRMAGSLWRYWEIRGDISEGRAILNLALDRNPDASPYQRANGLRGAGMLARLQADYTDAIEMHRESLALFRQVKFSLGIARELDVLGEISQYMGDYSAAIQYHNESLAIRYEIEDKEGIAISLGQLGVIARDRGDYVKANAFLEESLELCHEQGDWLLCAQAHNNLGGVKYLLCNYKSANSLFSEALGYYRVLNDQPGISNTLYNLGNVAKDQGEFKQARALYQECLDLRERLGDRRGFARVKASLAEVATHQGNYPYAKKLTEESLAIFRRLGVTRGIVVALELLAHIAYYQGDYEQAISFTSEVTAIAGDVASPLAIAYTKNVLGNCAYAADNLDEAREYFHGSVEVFDRLGDRRNVASGWVNLARTAYRQGDHVCAKEFLENSLSVARELKTSWAASYALEISGLIERSEGNYSRALELFQESLRISIEQENQQGIANCFGALAGLAAVTGQSSRAATFFAAAEKIREQIGVKMGISDKQEYDRYLNNLRKSLDQYAFKQAWEVGMSLTPKQALDELGDWKNL